MRVFIVNENSPIAMSLVKKLSNVKNGQLIPVTLEEYKYVKGGNLIPLEMPEAGVVTASVPQQEKKPEVAKTTEGQKLPGTSPKSPVV